MGSKITRKQTCHFVYPMGRSAFGEIPTRAGHDTAQIKPPETWIPVLEWFPGTLGASVLRHVPTYMDEVSKTITMQSRSEQKDKEDQSLINHQSPAGCSPHPLHDLRLDPQSWDQRRRFIDPKCWIRHQVHSPAKGRSQAHYYATM